MINLADVLATLTSSVTKGIGLPVGSHGTGMTSTREPIVVVRVEQADIVPTGLITPSETETPGYWACTASSGNVNKGMTSETIVYTQIVQWPGRNKIRDEGPCNANVEDIEEQNRTSSRELYGLSLYLKMLNESPEAKRLYTRARVSSTNIARDNSDMTLPTAGFQRLVRKRSSPTSGSSHHVSNRNELD